MLSNTNVKKKLATQHEPKRTKITNNVKAEQISKTDNSSLP